MSLRKIILYARGKKNASFEIHHTFLSPVKEIPFLEISPGHQYGHNNEGNPVCQRELCQLGALLSISQSEI